MTQEQLALHLLDSLPLKPEHRAHAEAVAEEVRRTWAGHPSLDRLVAVALCHDLVEDRLCTFATLLQSGIDAMVIPAVVSITRMHGHSYAEYISGLSLDAAMVKLCDLRVNMQRHPPKGDLLTRYKATAATIVAKLRTIGMEVPHE